MEDKQRAIEALTRAGFKPFPNHPTRYGRRSQKHPGGFLTPNVDAVKPNVLDHSIYEVTLHVAKDALPALLHPLTVEQVRKAALAVGKRIDWFEVTPESLADELEEELRQQMQGGGGE
jgi:hypothetical protein